MKTTNLGTRNASVNVAFAALRAIALITCFAAAPLSALAAPANGRLSASSNQKGGERMLALCAEEVARLALPSEADNAVLKKLAEAAHAQPTETRLFPTTRAGKTTRLAIEQRGPGTSDHLFVFVHGCLADHETWLYVAGAMDPGQDCWLVDLPGCGNSDPANPKDMEPDAYSPTGMAERVLQALEQALAASPKSRRVTLVAHSLGGTICLRMFGDPALRVRHPSVLRQVDGLVAVSPGDVAVCAPIPAFVQVLQLKSWKAATGRALGVAQAKVRETIRNRFHDPAWATEQQARRLLHVLTDSQHLQSAQAMLLQAVPWRMKERRPDWPEMDQLATHYANVDVPCLIVWGEWDETLPASMGHKIRDSLPNARLITVPRSGHSLPGEKPLECATLIRDFSADLAAGNFAGRPAVSRFGVSATGAASLLAGPVADQKSSIPPQARGEARQ